MYIKNNKAYHTIQINTSYFADVRDLLHVEYGVGFNSIFMNGTALQWYYKFGHTVTIFSTRKIIVDAAARAQTMMAMM